MHFNCRPTIKKILAPPSFEIKKRTQTALISENTVLQCEAKGEKPIGVLWNMNNKRLDANVDPRYTIREESQVRIQSAIVADNLQKGIVQVGLLTGR